MRALVSVTIVSWNHWPLLEQCVHSVQRQSYPHREIIVVDQGSADGTAAQMARRFPEARLIANAANTLYCRGQNQAIRAARGEHVLALNNDVVLHPDFLVQTMAAMAADERVGMVCGKVLSWDARHLDGAGQQRARSGQPEDRGYRRRDGGQCDRPADVFGPGGAAPLFRRAMLEEIAEGGDYFDERFGCFFEDLDLAWRAQRRGWRARYTPQAVAYHYRGASAQGTRPHGVWPAGDLTALPDALVLRYLANRRYVLRKHRAWRTSPQRWPWMAAYDAGLWAYLGVCRPHLVPAALAGRTPTAVEDG